MFEREEIIEIAKSRLGHPIVQIELTDEICNNLFSDSVSTFEYYATLSKNYESNSLNKVTKKEFFEIRYNWVLRYFTASLKESLGNVRGKYSGEINTPEGLIKLDYSHLTRESESEKIAIIKDIYPQYEYNVSPFVLLGVYVSVGNLSSKDISSMLLKIQKDFKSSLPDFIKLVIK